MRVHMYVHVRVRVFDSFCDGLCIQLLPRLAHPIILVTHHGLVVPSSSIVVAAHRNRFESPQNSALVGTKSGADIVSDSGE